MAELQGLKLQELQCAIACKSAVWVCKFKPCAAGGLVIKTRGCMTFLISPILLRSVHKRQGQPHIAEAHGSSWDQSNLQHAATSKKDTPDHLGSKPAPSNQQHHPGSHAAAAAAAGEEAGKEDTEGWGETAALLVQAACLGEERTSLCTSSVVSFSPRPQPRRVQPKTLAEQLI